MTPEEAKLILEYSEPFTEQPVDVLEVMEGDKEMWSFFGLYERFIENGKPVFAGRLGQWIERKFNLGLANK